MDRRIKYDINVQKDASWRVRKVSYKLPHEDSSCWRTVPEISREIGRSRTRVKSSLNAGRPPDVSAHALYIDGGEYDGQWLTVPQIREILKCGRTFVRQRTNGADACFKWEIPKKIGTKKKDFESTRDSQTATQNWRVRRSHGCAAMLFNRLPVVK